MSDLKQTMHRGFDVGRQLSIAVFAVGVLLLLSHLAGQVREGFASEWSLWLGVGCLLAGLVFTLQFTILIRLDRIERQLVHHNSGPVHADEEKRNSTTKQSDEPRF